jgi:arginyl-tRNA synthetase
VTTLDALRAAVIESSAALREGGAGAGATPTLEQPKRDAFGDYSTNAAMLLAPVLGDAPRTIAEKLGTELSSRLGGALDRFEVAGPGFLNLFLTDGWYGEALAGVLAAGTGYGGGGATVGERVLVEFVSANPTGPLTAASGRHAAFGDALSRILAFHGHHVQREYYFNDAGSQVERLGDSIGARARGEDVPEDGYTGEYVTELARQIPDAAELSRDALSAAGIELMWAQIRHTLEGFGVRFDRFFSERVLHEGTPSPIERAYAQLEAAGHLYRSEGALWLRTTAFGDDKDRVLERRSGQPTYFAADVAYHADKLRRGFERLIDPLGADHHGYIGRMKAAMAALGADPEALEVLILQFVHVVEGGERASMSKRRGEFVTLDDLVAEIGVDAARWFLLSRSHDTTVDLDLELARSQSNENPVYYVQYAHARIASVRRKAGEERVAGAVAGVASPPAGLHPAERALIKKLLAYPAEVDEAAARRAPHRIAAYALELAQEFTAFYRDCRVVGAEPEAVEAFRLALCEAAQRTIAAALGLLGVGAPEHM